MGSVTVRLEIRVSPSLDPGASLEQPVYFRPMVVSDPVVSDPWSLQPHGGFRPMAQSFQTQEQKVTGTFRSKDRSGADISEAVYFGSRHFGSEKEDISEAVHFESRQFFIVVIMDLEEYYNIGSYLLHSLSRKLSVIHYFGVDMIDISVTGIRYITKTG